MHKSYEFNLSVYKLPNILQFYYTCISLAVTYNLGESHGKQSYVILFIIYYKINGISVIRIQCTYM